MQQLFQAVFLDCEELHKNIVNKGKNILVPNNTI